MRLNPLYLLIVFFIHSCNFIDKNPSTPDNFIPKDASIIIRIHNPNKFKSDVLNNSLALNVFNNEDNYNFKKQIKIIGRKVVVIEMDVTKKETIKSLINESKKEFDQIHVFFNNAGVSTMNQVIDISEEEWDYNMNVNLKGVFLCCQHQALFLIKQGHGKIINNASMAGKRGASYLAHYAASKYGVIGFSKSLALELAPYGITVNCICPGFVKTDMQKREIEWEAKIRNISESKVKKRIYTYDSTWKVSRTKRCCRYFYLLGFRLFKFHDRTGFKYYRWYRNQLINLYNWQ